MTASELSLRFIAAVAVALVVGVAGFAASEAHAYAGAPRDDIRRMVVEEALQSRNVPPSLALAVAKVESNFNPQALSSAGARGVMQIMPATGRGVFGVHPDSLWEARLNVQLGVRFLDDLIDRYGGRWDLALSHYNGGSRVGTPPNAQVIPETRDYVAAVLAWQRKYERSETVVAMAEEARGAQPVATSRRAGNLPYADVPSEYLMFDDRSTTRDWRHYLNVADYWLRKPWQKAPAAEAPVTAAPAAGAPVAAAPAAGAEQAYPTYFTAASPMADERPSIQLNRSIEERRSQFRDTMNRWRAW